MCCRSALLDDEFLLDQLAHASVFDGIGNTLEELIERRPVRPDSGHPQRQHVPAVLVGHLGDSDLEVISDSIAKHLSWATLLFERATAVESDAQTKTANVHVFDPLRAGVFCASQGSAWL